MRSKLSSSCLGFKPGNPLQSLVDALEEIGCFSKRVDLSNDLKGLKALENRLQLLLVS